MSARISTIQKVIFTVGKVLYVFADNNILVTLKIEQVSNDDMIFD